MAAITKELLSIFFVRRTSDGRFGFKGERGMTYKSLVERWEEEGVDHYVTFLKNSDGLTDVRPSKDKEERASKKEDNDKKTMA